MKYHLLIILFVAGLSSQTAAGQSGAQSSYRFLGLPVTARTAALGGNHVALASGEGSLFTINPGYLTESGHKELSFSYLSHLAGIYLGTASFTWHSDKLGTLATDMKILNYGQMSRTDNQGAESGTFGAYDFAWSVAIARTVYPDLQAGIGLQLIHSGYDMYRSSALALFGGLYYRFNNEHTHAGFSFQHLGTQITRFGSEDDDLPFTLSAGLSHRLQHLPLRFNLTLHSLNQWEIPVFDDEDPDFLDYLFRHVRFGAEVLLSENIQLRLGYDHLTSEELKTDRRIDASGTGIGLGLKIREHRIDISRVSLSETGGLILIHLATGL